MTIVDEIMRDATVERAAEGDTDVPFVASVYLDTDGAFGLASRTVTVRGVDEKDALRELKTTVAALLAGKLDS